MHDVWPKLAQAAHDLEDRPRVHGIAHPPLGVHRQAQSGPVIDGNPRALHRVRNAQRLLRCGDAQHMAFGMQMKQRI